jgi:hypothetical protein
MGLNLYRGFESLRLRQKHEKPRQGLFYFQLQLRLPVCISFAVAAIPRPSVWFARLATGRFRLLALARNALLKLFGGSSFPLY